MIKIIQKIKFQIKIKIKIKIRIRIREFRNNNKFKREEFWSSQSFKICLRAILIIEIIII
jgi:hypothetical protein